METNTPTPIITKRIMHKGIEIRRSNEMTNSNAYLHTNPMMWVVDAVGSKQSFNTQKQAEQWIDAVIQLEAKNAFSDWSGNYWIVRPVDGKFTEVTITRDEFIAIRKAGE